MGRSLFKKTRNRPIPQGAEIISKRGKAVARWIDGHGNRQEAPVTADGEHIRIEQGTYSARYRTADGRLVEFSTGARTQDAAAAILRERENFEAKIRCGAISPEEAMVSSWGSIDFGQHINAWLGALKGRGRTELHIRDMRYKAERLARECRIRNMVDISRNRIENWLHKQAENGMPPKTRNHYLVAIRGFCNWAIRAGRMAVNPLNGIEKANENVDRVKIRRALTPEELRLFLEAARSRPLHDVMYKNRGSKAAQLSDATIARFSFIGEERRMTYLLLATTGLRKSELASIRLCDAQLDGAKPFLELRAEKAKNRKAAKLPLRRDVADELVQHVARRLETAQKAAKGARRPIPAVLSPQSPLVLVPSSIDKIFQRDIEHAKIPRVDARGRAVDVHALRTTFGSHLALSGIPLRTAQELMRHSDPKLTANVYQDVGILDTFGAVESMPSFCIQKNESRLAAQDGGNGPTLCPPICPPLDAKTVHFSASDCTEVENHHTIQIEQQDNKKPPINTAFSTPVYQGSDDLVGSGGRIRTYDLWVMSPTSYQAAPPRDNCSYHSKYGGESPINSGRGGGLAIGGGKRGEYRSAVSGISRARSGVLSESFLWKGFGHVACMVGFCWGLGLVVPRRLRHAGGETDRLARACG